MSQPEVTKEPTLEEKLGAKKEFAWKLYDTAQRAHAYQLVDPYFDFLKFGRTERERVAYVVKLAEKAGFHRLEMGHQRSQLKPGDKVYYVNREKNIALAVIGTTPMTDCVHIIGSHIDTPRLDLRLNPLYDDTASGLALMKTHYYGGVKKYQWATIPLHLTGLIVKTDGSKIPVSIGKDPQDPVFTIPDLLPHLQRTVQDTRTTNEVIKAEEMNIIAGGFPLLDQKDKDVKEKFKIAILKLLNEKYGIIEQDLTSAELNLVSGLEPRYVGFDKAILGGAGHDDGVCAWTSIKALFDLPQTPHATAVACLFDKEEIGSTGSTGAESMWLKFTIHDLMVRTGIADTPTNLFLTLTNCKVLSADVTAAFDPSFKSVHDALNVAVLGKGVNILKYTGGGGKYNASDATAEMVASIRNLLESNKIPYQITLLGEVDKGGGGTIAKYVAQTFNCDVIDVGTPVLNMHSPFELIHVADFYATYLAYLAFFKE